MREVAGRQACIRGAWVGARGCEVCDGVNADMIGGVVEIGVVRVRERVMVTARVKGYDYS